MGLDGWSFLSSVIAPFVAILCMSFLLIVYMSPSITYIPETVLVEISPGRLFAIASDPAFDAADGPSIRMGMLGSCAQWSNHVLRQNCTGPSMNPKYDLHSLPSGTPNFPNPSTGTPVAFTLGSLAWLIFTVIYSFTKIHLWVSFSPQLESFLKEPIIAIFNLILGFFFGWLFVLASSLAALSTFQSGVQIFNNEEAVKGPPYHAELGNGFNYLWAFCGLSLIPLFVDFVERVFEERSQEDGLVRGAAAPPNRRGRQVDVPALARWLERLNNGIRNETREEWKRARDSKEARVLVLLADWVREGWSENL